MFKESATNLLLKRNIKDLPTEKDEKKAEIKLDLKQHISTTMTPHDTSVLQSYKLASSENICNRFKRTTRIIRKNTRWKPPSSFATLKSLSNIVF